MGIRAVPNQIANQDAVSEICVPLKAIVTDYRKDSFARLTFSAKVSAAPQQTMFVQQGAVEMRQNPQDLSAHPIKTVKVGAVKILPVQQILNIVTEVNFMETRAQ